MKKRKDTFQALTAGQPPGDQIDFGTVINSDARLSYNLDELCGSHYLCGATTGHGKSRWVDGFIIQCIRRLISHGQPGVIVLDPKSETVDLLLRLLASELPKWNKAQRKKLFESLTVIAPCRRQAAITPLQLLRANGHEAEARAAEISEALTHGIESELGVLQEIVLGNILALAIESKQDLSLVEIPYLLADEQRLRQLAEKSSLAGPRSYILSGRYSKEAARRVTGIQGRIEKLLRIERLRLALGAPGLVNLKKAFQGGITLIDLGNDYGADESSRIVGRLLFARLSSILFSSSPDELKPTLLVCEEFPDLVGKGLGAKAERIFSQARSRLTSCMVLFQAPAQLNVGGLLRVLQANARFSILGQMPATEVRFFEDILPSTGDVPRPLLPGEVLPKSSYLAATEERAFRIAGLSRLPRRCFFVSDRLQANKGYFIKADNCAPPSWDELAGKLGADQVERVKRGSVSVTLEAAKKTYQARLKKISAPTDKRSKKKKQAALPIKRRQRRKGGIP